MKIMMPQLKIRFERWKWSKEFHMYVSNLGHFRDIHRQPLPQYVNKNGYMTVQTPHGYSFVHRVVMKTWRPTIDMDHLTVDHLDHNKRDNSVYNLEWVSASENQSRARNDQLSNEDEKKLDNPLGKTTSSDKSFVCYKGNQKIYSCSLLSEASRFLKEHESSLKDVSMENIRKGIHKSINTGVFYAKHLWKYE